MGNSLFDEFAFLGEAEPDCVENSLYEWCMNNGNRGKQILEEWNEEKNVNYCGVKISPREVKRGSDKPVWWKCPRCGNIYQLPIRWRLRYIVGCSKCRTKGSSFSEVLIFYGIQAKFPMAQHRVKCGEKKLEFDIVIPEINVFIEYSGEYWHSNNTKNDEAKINYCIEKNIRFINIIETKKAIPLTVEGDVIYYKYSEHNQHGMLKMVLMELYKLLGVEDLEIDYDKMINEANDRMLRPLKGSVLDVYPQLNSEFDDKINNGAKLNYFSVSSANRISWKCTKCKNVWGCTISNRTEFKTGCPYCGYNVFDGKIHYSARNKKQKPIIPGEFSL